MKIKGENTMSSDKTNVSLKKEKESSLSSNLNEELDPTSKTSEMDSCDKKPKKAKKRNSKLSTDETTEEKKIKIDSSSNINGFSKENIPLNQLSAKTEFEEVEENGDAGEDETAGEPKITDKEASQITGKSLRASFNSADGLMMLRKFVTICNNNQKYDLAVQYLNAGGSALEILKLLDSADKKTPSVIATVFSAMEIVLLKILEKFPQYHSSAAEACRYLINSHLSSIHSMMSSQSNAKQRKVVLRLLTAIVALKGNLPRELLGHLSFHSQLLDTLSKHTEPTDEQSVRTNFIKFIMSFMWDENVSVIRALLDKRGVISSIFPGLMYDTYKLVDRVLSVISCGILMNPGISKTIKLHTFSTPVIQNLVSLYNWKGPKNWPGKNKKKNYEESSGYTDPDEKKYVVEAVHKFLLLLLTSNKFGIIFHDRSIGTSGQRNNQLANTILQSLDRPWEHAKPADLVVKILVACPDLIRSQLTYIEPYLEPKVSQKWILIMDFLQQIVVSLDAAVCIKPYLLELTTLQIFSVLTTLTVPLTVLKNAIAPGINHNSVIVRHTSIILLTNQLRQLKNFMDVIKKSNIDVSDEQKIRNLLTDYLLKNVPSLDSVLVTWNKALSPETESEEDLAVKTSETITFPNPEESLTALLDLLLLYQNVCPQLLETSSMSNSSIDSSKLLTGLNTLKNVNEEELDKMKVKAIQFLLALDSSSFAPDKELFGEAVPFVISLLDSGKESTLINSHSRTAIKTLLNICGVFEGCSYQADIWINNCLDLDSVEEKTEIATWLVEIIRETAKYTNKYIELITKAEEAAGERLYSSTAIEDIFTDLMERDIKIASNKRTRLLPSVSISPLLPAALESVKCNGKDLVLHYLSRVSVQMLHCQVVPNTLIHLVQNIKELPSQLYISSWLPNSEHIYIKKLFGSKNLMSKLSKVLLKNERIDVSKIFRGTRKISFKFEDEAIDFEHSMNSDDVLALLRLSVFYYTQLMQEEKLNDDLNYNVKVIIVSLLHVAKEIDSVVENSILSQECCEWILAHPVIFRYFSPLHEKKNLVQNYSTETVAYICSTIVRLFGEQKISNLLIPFKEKFITKLLSAARKLQNGGRVKDSSTVVQFVETLQLNIKDIANILTTVLELPPDSVITTDKTCLTMWGLIIPKLLIASTTRKNYPDDKKFLTLDKSIIEKICQRTIQLNLQKNECLDLWIHSILVYLQRFPHNIIGVDKNFLLSLIKGTTSPSAVRLASFLISRNTRFIPIYVKYALNNSDALKNKEAVFSILLSIPDHLMQPHFLAKLYDFYKDEISSWFLDPESVDACVKTNVKSAIRLIEAIPDPKTCNAMCEMVLSNGDKLLTVDMSYIEILKSVFIKAGRIEDVRDNRLADFVQILIHVMVSTLKKESKNIQKHISLCQTLLDTLDLIQIGKNSSQYSEIRKNHFWAQFTRFSLKLGLKTSKENDDQVPLIKVLVKLSNIVYEDNSDDDYIKTLFEMTTSHSEFINIMLGTSSTKRDLVELLLILVRKNNSLMASKHVPLYLGAYNATLSETDQLILQLLQYYESRNIKLTDYRPYLWGSAAASHYSIKSGSDTALWRQPSTSQVLDLFVPETVNNTIKNYPIKRKLKDSEMHTPQLTYDPAFYLPLLCYLLSDNSVIACHKVTQSGALALALSACGSTESQTRLAAYTVISRFYHHLEATNSKEKLLWLHFIDTFRNGISSSKPELEDVQLSCLTTTFMARTSLVTTQPLNPLYLLLQKFLMAKPALDLTTIPEFLQLFHSSEIDYKVHRLWILEVICDGLKTKLDADVAFRCLLFKMLFDFYTCVLADEQTKNLILRIVNSVAKIPNAAILLVTGYGLLPWLNEIVDSSDGHNLDFLAVFIDVIRNLYESLAKVHDKNEDVYFMLLRTMINLKQHLSRNLDIESYKNYITTLEKIVSFKTTDFCKILSIKYMTDLVQLSKTILGEINECEDILQFSAKFTAKTSSSLIQDNSVIAKDSLKKLLIMWSTSREV